MIIKIIKIEIEIWNDKKNLYNSIQYNTIKDKIQWQPYTQSPYTNQPHSTNYPA